MPAELYTRLARDGPVEALEAEFKLGRAPVFPSELCYRFPPHTAYRQALRWNDGTEQWINASIIWAKSPLPDGGASNPVGDAWAINPIPPIFFDSTSSGQPPGWSGCDPHAHGDKCIAFPPKCDGDIGWKPVNGSRVSPDDVEGRCSGAATAVTIVDLVQLPEWLSAGAYVLGWRWDCEETAQVWASCADVHIDAPTRIDGTGGAGGGEQGKR